MKGVFDPNVIRVNLKQTDDDVEKLFFVEKLVTKSPIVLVAKEPVDLQTSISPRKSKQVETYMECGIGDSPSCNAFKTV